MFNYRTLFILIAAVFAYKFADPGVCGVVFVAAGLLALLCKPGGQSSGAIRPPIQRVSGPGIDANRRPL